MAKVTSKLQVTLPKALADRYGIRPGAEIQWVAAGDVIHVVPAKQPRLLDPATRFKLLRATLARIDRLQTSRGFWKPTLDRGWRREDLYTRGRPR